MNRLLVNMKSKVEVINGAIDMIYRLRKGEKITLNGINNIVVTAGNISNEQFEKRLCELFKEKENLEKRISYFR